MFGETLSSGKSKRRRYESYRDQTDVSRQETKAKETPIIGGSSNTQADATLQRMISEDEKKCIRCLECAPQLLAVGSKREFQLMEYRTSKAHIDYQIISHVKKGSGSFMSYPIDRAIFFPPFRVYDLIDPSDSGSSTKTSTNISPLRSSIVVEKNNNQTIQSRVAQPCESLAMLGSPEHMLVNIDIETLFQILYAFLPNALHFPPYTFPIFTMDNDIYFGSSIIHPMLTMEVCTRTALQRLFRTQLKLDPPETKMWLKLGEITIETSESTSDEYIFIKLECSNVARTGASDNPVNYEFAPLSTEELCKLRFASEFFPVVRCIRIDSVTLNVLSIQTYRISEQTESTFEWVFGDDPMPEKRQRDSIYEQAYDFFLKIDSWTKEMGPGKFILHVESTFVLYKEKHPSAVSRKSSVLSLASFLEKQRTRSSKNLLGSSKGNETKRPWWSWGASSYSTKRNNRSKKARDINSLAPLSSIIFLKKTDSSLDVYKLND